MYTGISGDNVMVDSLELDRVTGVITITDNSHLDRETKDSEYLFNLHTILVKTFCLQLML